MPFFRPDLVIKNTEGMPIAIVEVQSWKNLTEDVAMKMKRNMVEDGLPIITSYFLLLSQDIGYLWTKDKLLDPNAPPSYKFPMENIVKRYMKKEYWERRFVKSEMEFLILRWLINLSANPEMETEEPEETLNRAGFNALFKNNIVFIEETL